MSELRINFAAKYLPILDLFKAKIDIRYYLRGVYVEKAPHGGVYVVACDGHTLAAIYDKDGFIEGAENAVVSVEPGLVAAAKKADTKQNKGLGICVNVRGTRAKVSIPDSDSMELFIQPGKCLIECAFPKWRTVLPDFDKLKPGMPSSLAVNSNYMARFCKIPADKTYPGMTLWQEPAEGKPVVVQMLHLPEAIFVVMPMRHEGDAAHFSMFKLPKQEPTALEAMAEPA